MQPVDFFGGVDAAFLAVVDVRCHEYEQLALGTHPFHVLEQPADDGDGAQEGELPVDIVLAFLDHAAEHDRFAVKQAYGRFHVPFVQRGRDFRTEGALGFREVRDDFAGDFAFACHVGRHGDVRVRFDFFEALRCLGCHGIALVVIHLGTQHVILRLAYGEYGCFSVECGDLRAGLHVEDFFLFHCLNFEDKVLWYAHHVSKADSVEKFLRLAAVESLVYVRVQHLGTLNLGRIAEQHVHTVAMALLYVHVYYENLYQDLGYGQVHLVDVLRYRVQYVVAAYGHQCVLRLDNLNLRALCECRRQEANHVFGLEVFQFYQERVVGRLHLVRADEVDPVADPERVRCSAEQVFQGAFDSNTLDMGRCVSVEFAVDHCVNLGLREDFAHEVRKGCVDGVDVQEGIDVLYAELTGGGIAAVAHAPAGPRHDVGTVFFGGFEVHGTGDVVHGLAKFHVLEEQCHWTVGVLVDKDVLARSFHDFSGQHIERCIFHVNRELVVFPLHAEFLFGGLRLFGLGRNRFENVDDPVFDFIFISVADEQHLERILERLVVEVYRDRTRDVLFEEEV